MNKHYLYHIDKIITQEVRISLPVLLYLHNIQYILN